jgi:NTP pyrophosphatase (non-canonical NTP hydrolase)
MDAKTQADIIAAAVEHFGHIHQMIKTVEEAGELQRAIARLIQYNLETREPEPPELIENLIEETADVGIMIKQLTYILGVDVVTEAEEKKLRRLAERMGMQIEEDAP